MYFNHYLVSSQKSEMQRKENCFPGCTLDAFLWVKQRAEQTQLYLIKHLGTLKALSEGGLRILDDNFV